MEFEWLLRKKAAALWFKTRHLSTVKYDMGDISKGVVIYPSQPEKVYKYLTKRHEKATHGYACCVQQ